MIPEPHGGRLVDRLVPEAERRKREAEAADLPSVTPFLDQVYDTEKIGIGSYSPLEGFMDGATVASVVASGRLPSGLPWTMPIVFPLPKDDPGGRLAALRPGDDVLLRDPASRPLAILTISERFRLDRGAIARSVYGTEDPAHPNVADLLAAGELAWAGPIRLLRRLDPPEGRPEPSPAELRAEFARRGWSSVAGYQCRNPPHTAHEYLQRLTLERSDVDGLLIHPVVGRLKKGDYRPGVILAAYEALVEHYYPAARVLVRPLSITMRYAGPKAALFLAIVRKNYGCGAYIVGRDQAGVGSYYDPFACHRIFDAYDLGIQPLRYGESFYCRRCGWMATEKVCPHPASDRIDTSQSRIRRALAESGPIPPEIVRPEVAAILRGPDVLLT